MITGDASTPALSPLKRAFLAIEDLQARLAASESARREPVAIIGLGCRFPGGADTPAAYWDLLAKGSDAVSEVPASRWPVESYFDADPMARGKMSARHGGFLGDIESFDPVYFGISPREAASMDPQHRLLLEVAWEALSASGQRRDRLAGSQTGVFVGVTTVEYGQLQLAAEGVDVLDTYHITGNALNAASGRLAFVFGLHGPCMAVDTACSSSLVALHLACQSLRAGECETALAGGVNLILSPLGSIALSKGRVLSADGRARAFDAGADGMVRGEGCGLLVLKRLSAAERDGDRILAVVRGSGVNQDGPSSGLTVPNGPAQEQLLRQVLTNAQLESSAVDYVEAHGTGTALGDPIEVGALGAVYGKNRPPENPLWLGSVKTNFGHLESAAGIAGVIKAVLALHHEAIPPHLHFSKPSPHIDWKNLPLRVPVALTPWRRGERARYAGVSAFGFSGTNAHVIIGEAPSAGAVDDGRGLVAPPSPFNRERFPLPKPASFAAANRTSDEHHPLLGAELSLAGTTERRFDQTLTPGSPSWLADHRVFGTPVVPAAALLEMIHAAGRVTHAGAAIEVVDFSIQQALALPDAQGRQIQTVVRSASAGRWAVELHSRSPEGWTLHASATLGVEKPQISIRASLATARARCAQPGGVEKLYADYAARGLGYGPAFRAITALWRGDGETLAEIRLPSNAGKAGAFSLHPVLLDACFQSAGAAFGDVDADDVFLPASASRWSVAEAGVDRLWCHARAAKTSAGATIDLVLFAEDGRVVGELAGLVLQRATKAALQRAIHGREEWLYEISWAPAPLSNAATTSTGEGDWLIVRDRGKVAEQLAMRLRHAGATVMQVSREELAASLTVPTRWSGMVYLASLDVSDDAAPTTRSLGLESLLQLARGHAPQRGLWIATRTAVAVANAHVSPAAAALWGFARVFAQEHPEAGVRLVDVDSADAAVDALTTECLGADVENQTAWRGGQRHAARLVRISPAPEKALAALRADAAYLVTGGLGGLGIIVAEWLIRRGAKHLVLAGRKGPSRSVAEKISAWTTGGVRVDVVSVDVSQRTAVQALLAGLPNLRGILHAAGVLADGALRNLTAAQCDLVLAAKADAARHLDEFAGPLDFFILFSSAAAILGTAGQANYAAANAYLDGLAHARRARGATALSVNWGPWAAGMAAGLGDKYAAKGVGSISPARGLEMLEQLLASDIAQAAVLPIHWPHLFAALPAGTPPPLIASFAPVDRGSVAAGSVALDVAVALRAAAPEARTAMLTETLRTEVARVLGISLAKLASDQPLTALGLDSMMAVDLRSRLRTTLGSDVPVVAFLEGATIAELVERLLADFAQSAPVEARAPAPGVTRELKLDPTSHALSAGQAALWFLHQAAPASPAYNTAVAMRLRGTCDVPALRRSLETLLARHPLLRSAFELVGGQPMRRESPTATLAFAEVDVAGKSETEIAALVAADYQRPYELAAGPLFRATRFQINAGDSVLLLGVHHIVGDAWTNWLLLTEFRQLYAAATAGKSVALPEVVATYGDFVRWQQELLASADGARLEAFWKNELAGELAPLALPTDFARPAVLEPQGASVPLVLPVPLWEQLRTLGRKENVTPFALLLAAFQVLLHRHSGQDDLIVGSPTSGRSRPEFAGIAGYFVNPVPMRAQFAPGLTFASFLAQTRRTVLQALEHADFPLPLLVERLGLPRDTSRSALFQTLFVYQKPQQSGAEGAALRKGGVHLDGWGGLDVSEFPLAQMEGQFELTLEIFEGGAGSLKFNRTLFTRETAERFARRFQTLLAGIVADPTQAVDALPCMDAAEREQVVRQWNHTPANYPQALCLHELIAAQVTRTPEAVAVSFEGNTLTYRALETRANQLAHALMRAGVRADTLVGVCAERSLELVVALLGILKAGGAYVPLDPAYPRDRLAFMHEDSGVALVLTQERFAPDLERQGTRVLCVDRDWSEIAHESVEAPIAAVTPDHLAYMIYTSGSTGRPKGALNTHRAIVNRLLWMQEQYQLTAADAVVQKTPFSFDVSVWEFFWPLLTGARLVVARPGGHQDAAYLAQLVATEKVTTMHFVPSMLQVFVEEPALSACTRLRQVFCSGEALPFELQERFFARHPAELHNLYGPTEAAVDVTFWRCERGSSRKIVPIGRPIARTQMYVLDRRLAAVPVGVAGELHIGGIGLARGYHGRPELTAEKFIPDPFGGPGARLYKTGDLARWLPDGSIEYLGRLDHQVKLRGFRIELGEIEAALAREPGVREAVVIVREDRPGEKSLTAYIVTKSIAVIAVDDLRRALRLTLPDYMVPSDIVILPALPLSPNGKVDRRKLPAPSRERPVLAAALVKPSGETEMKLAEIWRAVLGREQVGAEDNFFDLGGHSLRLGQVHARLQTTFPTPPPLMELFQFPTIRSLATRLDGGTAAVSTASPPREMAAGSADRGERRGGLVDQRALRRAARRT